MKKSFLIGLLCCLISTLHATSITLQEPTNLKHWIQTQFNAKSAPFTFVYDGQSSKQLLPAWKYNFSIKEDNATCIQCVASYTDPKTHLRVSAHITGYKDFQEVDWTLFFSNHGATNTPIIEQVNAIDIVLTNKQAGDYLVNYARGTDAQSNDFEPIHLRLGNEDSLHLATVDGRSSSVTALPFFLLHAPNQSGVVFSIGWSGSWQMQMDRQDARALSLSAGMPNTHLVLYPQEQIRTPLISLLFFTDESTITGHNKFRQFVKQHCTPKLYEQVQDGLLCGGFDWGDPEPCTEYSCLDEELALTIVHRYKKFNIVPDVFWLDAGWYRGCSLEDGSPRYDLPPMMHNSNWSAYVGNWEVDSVRFPNGFKPISDEIHRLGAKFLVWFEPERVRPNTEIAIEHPEWCLHTSKFDHTYLFDMGNPEARDWMAKRIGDIMEENGIDYYRQDCNTELTAFWQDNDAPNRQGIHEIRHIEGLYAFWDQLRQRFPDMLIDNCAGGGRRVDLESLRRSVLLWRSDNTIRSKGKPTNMQNQTFGLNYFIPIQASVLYNSDPYYCISSLSGAMQMNFHLFESGYKIRDMQNAESIYRQCSPYFLGDFYPLTGDTTTEAENVWFAYQLNDPVSKSGIVLAYRRYECEQNELTVKLNKLNPTATYIVHINQKGGRIYTGQELMQGLTINSTHKGEAFVVHYAQSEQLSQQTLLDKIKGAWAGQAIGCTYGGPTEFRYRERMIDDSIAIQWPDGYLTHYFDKEPGLYDDIYMDITFVKVFEQLGLDAPINAFAQAFTTAPYPLWHANQQARYNIMHGIQPPQSGYWENNPHADDIDFQIEADYAGIMAPGMVNAAAFYCDSIGHIMNYGDGWYGGVYVAAMYALAFINDDINYVVEEALKVIPKQSKYYQCMADVIAWHKQYPNDWKTTWQLCQNKWGSEVGCPDGVLAPFNIDAIINSAYILIGLLYGEQDFEKTIDIATRCGQDSDCNPASAGGILATMLGYSQIPDKFMANLHEVEDRAFAYTDISLNTLYQMSLNQALQVIGRNGGEVTEDAVTIRLQKPKAVRLEQAFTGLQPKERIKCNLPVTETEPLSFEGKGVVVGYSFNHWGSDYAAKVEVKLDGKVVETVALPNNQHDRAPQLFYRYNLSPTAHTISFRWLNPTDDVQLSITNLLIYE